MAAKRTTQKTTAIVKVLTPKQIQTLGTWVQEAGLAVNNGLTRLSQVLSETNLPDNVMGLAWGKVKEWAKAMETIEDIAKKKMASAVQARGVKDPDTKGTMRLEVGDGMVVPIRPWRTGIDDKKLEAMLRAKGLDPERGMDTVVTYKKNDTKLGTLIGEKVITSDELAQCEYEFKAVVLAPELKKEE